MRLLLIAYEFPPSPSPQSLRWTYLARELDALGHEVHVLTADLGGHTPGLPALPASVVVHRSFAGPLRGLLAARRKQRERSSERDGNRTATIPAQPLRPPRNWKQRISEAVQGAAAFVHFPDIRGEWRPWGRRALERLLDEVRPELVISSHEPATSLELGLLARRRGLPWVADLGDPVLAGYTPRRWRRRARRLERDVCAHADLVTVTNPGAAALLRERHGDAARIEVITQGFDAGAGTRSPGADSGIHDAGGFDAGRLELLYTGSLYRFRRVDALLEALRANPAVRLNLAAVTVPERILQAAAALPGQLRLLGFLPHAAILAMQRRADVLVNIANDDHTQVPGKIYEYLGAGRPILHLGNGDDPTAALVEALQRGWVCRSRPDVLSDLLARLAAAHEAGGLDEGLCLDQHRVQEYSWQRIGRRLDALLRETAQGTADQRPGS